MYWVAASSSAVLAAAVRSGWRRGVELAVCAALCVWVLVSAAAQFNFKNDKKARHRLVLVS
jgi:hypothetical protein